MPPPAASYFDTSTWDPRDRISGGARMVPIDTPINLAIYVPMQGPSELGLSGTLQDWDRSKDLRNIDVPALVIGATHDTMDPEHMRWMSAQLPNGRYLHCPDGSHLSQFDDPDHYFPGSIDFVRSL